jgi:ubiquinone/menaquinone biosynthesis C-methylase UbiE
MNEAYSYDGEELLLFEKAINWKKYFSGIIKPNIGSEVLEVGAGLGTNTFFLNDNSPGKWILLEPDSNMSAALSKKKSDGLLPSNCEVVEGTLSYFNQENIFDTIIYIDVLEHIENDKIEIEKATSLLKPGGKLIVLAPAFQFLFSKFDKTIGHYRRYRKNELQKIMPSFMTRNYLNYLDSASFFLSAANRMLLKQKYPTTKQVLLWDRYVIPVSRVTDKIIAFSFGKTVLGMWKKK